MRSLIYIMPFLLGLSVGFADEVVEGITVGAFHVVVSGGKSEAREGSPMGVSVIRDRFDVIGKSAEIPLLKGHGLAVKFTLEGKYKDLESVRLVVKFPEMRAPNGEIYSKIDRTEKTRMVNGSRIVVFSYTFDEDWELVEGTWTIQIFSGNLLLGEALLVANNPERADPDTAPEPTSKATHP